MPEDLLSYERDIAPLQQRYFRQAFGTQGVRPEVAAKMSMQFSAGLDETLARQQKNAEFEDVRRNRQLQFDSALFTLEREREKAQRERTMLQSLGPLQAELDNVLNDPNEDYYAKQRRLGALGVRHAQTFATNPAAEVAYRAAQAGLVRAPKPDLTAANYVQAGGASKYLAAYEQSLGRPLQPEDELPFGLYAQGLEATAFGEKTSAQQLRAITAAEELRRRKSDELIGLVTKAKSAEKDPMTGKVDPTVLDSPMSLAAVEAVIAMYGSPEEQREAKEQNAAQKLALAQKMSTELLLDKRGPAAATPARDLTNLYTRQP